MKIFIARHGETDWNIEPARCQGWSDVPLNDCGVVQARELANNAKSKNIDLIVCSHLSRARQTASIIAKILNVEFIIDEGLAEAKKGLWEETTFESIAEQYPEIWDHWQNSPATAPIPGGETINEVFERVTGSICRLVQNENEKNLLLISHGGPISALRSFMDRGDLSAFHEMHPNNGHIFDVDISQFIITDMRITG